jgi:PmbA protein
MDANGQMQRDGWWSSARRLADLESPESIGKEAARRTFAGSAPAAFPRSACPSSLRRRWRGR